MLVTMRSILILAGLAISLAAASQDIYRWVDKNGVVHFSDQPGADNAVLIKTVEPNTMDAEESSSAVAASTGGNEDEPQEPEVAPYDSLSIVSPTPDQVFFGGDAVVTATAELGGTLRPDHSVVFFLNGNRHEATGLSMEFSDLARGSYFLRASILDQAGRPVISSQQTGFHVRQPSINSPQSPQARPPQRPSPPRPAPIPTPRPQPAPSR
jgi:hypothetical protein